MATWFKIALGAGFASFFLGAMTFALNAYTEDMVAQEVEARVAPIAVQQERANATLEAVLFQQRLEEDRELTNECLEAGRTDCEEESDWRWSTYYPWADCAAPFKDPKERTYACGERPEYERPD